jgi:hypothetical protein
MVLATGAANAYAGCDPSGSYKGNPALEQSVVVARTGESFEVWVHSSGQRVAGGVRTTGAAHGKLELSEHQCVGAYLAPEEECSLFFVFRAKGVDVHQFGHCGFGAGAWAGGPYTRVPENSSRARAEGASR